ncbi:MAG: hypothetical protein ABJB16_10895 [Saprospiraceae bacterium]
MKNAFWLGSIWLVLLQSACSITDNTSKESKRISTRDEGGEGEKVCILLQETYNLIDDNDFDYFFNDSLEYLIDLTSPTTAQSERITFLTLEGITNMKLESQDFEDAFDSVLEIDLSEEDLNDYFSECGIDSGRRCFICSTLGCKIATGIHLHSWVTLNPQEFLGSIALAWVFCNN